MTEYLYVLDDEVAHHLDADGQPNEAFVDKYQLIAEMLTSDNATALIHVTDGHVSLIVDDQSKGEFDSALGNGGVYPDGFTGYSREGLLESEQELLNQIRK